MLLFAFISIAFGNERNSKPVNSVNVHKWVIQHFAKGKIPPFSFVYGGKNSDSFIKGWKFQSENLISNDPEVAESKYTYTDPQSGLTVKCFVSGFTDFPAVEWVLKFENTSATNTPVIEKANVINYKFSSKGKGQFILHHAHGSNAERTDFQPIDEPLEIGKSIYMTPKGGRSSDNTAFPFFNLEMPGHQGVMVAVGWTGKWFADLVQTDSKSVSLKSGMEKLKLTLLPKEEIRTPKISLLFWNG